MMSRTHVMAGMAAAIVFSGATGQAGMAAALVGGAIGGVMPDIDLRLEGRGQKKLSLVESSYGEICALFISLSILLQDYIQHRGICIHVLQHPSQATRGLVVFILLMGVGIFSKHRDRTHSLLALAAFTWAVYQVHEGIGIAFAYGYASHLALDLLNMKPVRLFYPLKKGVCLNLCRADHWGNEIFFDISICVMALFLLK